MRREIEIFISACLEKMDEKGWSQGDLIRQRSSVSSSTLGHLLKGNRQPTAITVKRVGATLNIDEDIIAEAAKFARPGASGTQRKRMPPKIKDEQEQEKISVPVVKERLEQAWRNFEQGRNLLATVTEDVEKILRAINEELRLLEQTNGLAKVLENFRKK